MKCPKCGGEWERDAIRCPECGAEAKIGGETEEIREKNEMGG